MTQTYRLGELLINRGVITPQQLNDALEHQKQHSLSLGHALRALGHANRFQIHFALFKQHWLRAIATAVTLFLAPISQTFADQSSLEHLPEYSLTKVAQPPCPYQAFNNYNDMNTTNTDFDVMEVASTAVWYLSQGGVDTEKLASIPVHMSFTSKDLDDELSVNFSVRF